MARAFAPKARPGRGVSRPGDAVEEEAEQMARQATDAALAPAAERAPPAGAGGWAPAGGGGPPALPGGEPLSPTVRESLEHRFGHDFSQVRIHADSRAAGAAATLAARAFTIGSEIVFGAGQYAPGTAAGDQLLAHELAHTVQAQGVVQTGIQRQVYGPAEQTGAGGGFDDFLLQFQGLEGAAMADGYSLDQTITAFRNIWYPTGAPASTAAGATWGGSTWGILIPGAAGVKMPPSWSTPGLQGAVQYLRDHQELPINGQMVDIGHLFTGLDAGRHPTSINLAHTIQLRSNKEAATWGIDLGSVVVEYIHHSPTNMRDTAMVRSPVLEQWYDGANGQFSSADMASDADAYAFTIDPAKSLTENLRAYYTASAGSGATRRYSRLAASIGFGTLTGGRFSGDTPALRAALHEQVFNSALAYAAAQYRGDVLLVERNPGPGIFTPTHWEMYWNISGWVVEIFINRLISGVGAQP